LKILANFQSHIKAALKVLSSENLGGSKVVSLDSYCFSVWVLDIFLKLDFAKNFLPPLELKLLVLWEQMW
jgi:hypothetical protein